MYGPVDLSTQVLLTSLIANLWSTDGSKVPPLLGTVVVLRVRVCTYVFFRIRIRCKPGQVAVRTALLVLNKTIFEKQNDSHFDAVILRLSF